LATISCGAALHHARTALAAAGWQVEVAEFPDPDDPDHLAHLSLFDRQPATPEAARQVRAMCAWHTDRRPVSGTSVGPDAVLAVTLAVEEAGGWLHVLSPDRVVELGSAVAYAQRAEAADPAWRMELAYWTGGTRPDGTGVPDSVIPDAPTQTAVPSRDFGHTGELRMATGDDLSATYAILYGAQDAPVDWLRAGGALSAAWLTATELGVALVPMSAATEVPAAREVLCRLLPGPGQPYLVLRLGIGAPGDSARTPRLPARETVSEE
jgi:hypothetical protein